MKKYVAFALSSVVSLTALANQEAQTDLSAQNVPNAVSSDNKVTPDAPWDKIECRAMDIWGRVFTATGHNWKPSRAAELQNEALDKCSLTSGFQYCSPMGCVFY